MARLALLLLALAADAGPAPAPPAWTLTFEAVTCIFPLKGSNPRTDTLRVEITPGTYRRSASHRLPRAVPTTSTEPPRPLPAATRAAIEALLPRLPPEGQYALGQDPNDNGLYDESLVLERGGKRLHYMLPQKLAPQVAAGALKELTDLARQLAEAR